MNIQYNSHHSPVGAFSSFTLGHPGAKGGFGPELGQPADQHIYIGAERIDEPGVFEALPFFEESEDIQEDFVVHEQGDEDRRAPVRAIAWDRIQRELKPCSDSWKTDDLAFTLYTPTWSIPEPDGTNDEELKKILIPAIFAELTIDNTRGSTPRRAFFGYQPSNQENHVRENWNLKDKGITGLANSLDYGLATDSENAVTAIHFTIETLLGEKNRERFQFGNGTTGMIDILVEPGERATIRFVIAFHRAGIVTAGLDARYYYTRFFPTLDSVFTYGLPRFEAYKQAALELNRELEESRLTEDQKFQVAQSIHSYYGSTELLEHEGKPFWVVNEGEYRMMNTLDLTADQLYYELKQNPWTTRNVLENFVKLYSYRDRVFFPGDPDTTHEGGLSFTHDMGVFNCFTRPGSSCYEVPNLKGCFSYMTHEELVNWLCCATAYCHTAQDKSWQADYLGTFEDCFTSMVNRDHPDPEQRNGIMSLDSSKTVDGAEITTYDSLDVSLGQSRSNTYLAVKCWAAYLALEKLFSEEGRSELAAEARQQAERATASIVGSVKADGTIPAVIEGDHPSVIIPAIEGLVFPLFTGCEDALNPEGAFSSLIQVLATHFTNVLQPGVCLFDNGAWKLSSTSINSWLSKIYLCQHVARKVLGIDNEAVTRDADAAHVGWLTDPRNTYWAWSDQCYDGHLRGSKYYPRGVTSCLWLDE